MKAGFFEKDVTPSVGVYLAGYPSRNEPSQGVDDPLYLRIVAMEDDAGERVVLVTADLLKFPRDMAWRTKTWCESRLALPSSSLVINLSHSHATPGLFIQRCYPQWPVDVEYVRCLEQSIREGIQAALEDLQPVRIRYGLHQAHFGMNRRLPQPERGGKVRLGPNPGGYYDPDLPIFAFYRKDSLQAIVYSYACHPTSKNSLNISADWPGQVSQGLKRELGSEVLTAFVQGAGASVMTRKRLHDAGPTEYQSYWSGVAGEMAAFVRNGKMHEITLGLKTAETEFVIPYNMELVPSPEELLVTADPRDGPVPHEIRPANRSIYRLWARDILERLRCGSLDSGFRMHLTRIQLTDQLQIFAMSGEVTAEVGRMIKNLFPERETVFFGYCSYTGAYIPMASMLDEGGHEALASIYFQVRPAPFVKEIDDILSKEVLSLYEESE